MAHKPKNPIDPATGKRKRGRPPLVKPMDTIAGLQPTEQAIGVQSDVDADDTNALSLRDLNPDTATMTELKKMWYDRFGGTTMLDIPTEFKKKYPDGQFCWARDTAAGVSTYRTRFGYEPVESAKPLPGQTDTAFRHGDVILMVRPKWMKQVHDQLRRDTLLTQMGNPRPKEADERGSEQEALQEASASGYGQGNRNVSFFAEETQEDPDRVLAEERSARKQAFMDQPGRARLATGTKYVSGGFSK